jgi:hypothetical protein
MAILGLLLLSVEALSLVQVLSGSVEADWFTRQDLIISTLCALSLLMALANPRAVMLLYVAPSLVSVLWGPLITFVVTLPFASFFATVYLTRRPLLAWVATVVVLLALAPIGRPRTSRPESRWRTPSRMWPARPTPTCVAC